MSRRAPGLQAPTGGGRPQGRPARAHARLRALAAGVTLLLAVAFGAPPGAWAQTAEASGGAGPFNLSPTFGECETIVDEAGLRRELISGAERTMAAAAEAIDYPLVVERAWREADFDAKFARIVDAKIAILRADRPYLERLLDGNIPSRAREMAERTAELVFRSEEFAALQKDLEDAISAELNPKLSAAGVLVQDRTTACVHAFLGERYTRSVQAAFTADAAQLAFDGDAALSGAESTAAFNMAAVVAGILAVVFRRLLQRIVASIVRRLAGAIAARLAAWASLIAGVLLLIYELIAGADGVFPVIQEELTGEETRTEMQTALAEELALVGPEQLAARAAQIAETAFAQWRRFKDDHRAVLTLSDGHPRFRAFVADQGEGRFAALTAAVGALMAEGGETGVLDALDRGLLYEAILVPDLAQHLDDWRERGLGVTDLVAWRAKAGEGFTEAMRLGLPATMTIEQTSPEEVAGVLALEDRIPARRVAALSPDARRTALELSPTRLRLLAGGLDGPALEGALRAVAQVSDPSERLAFLQRVAAAPELAVALSGAGGRAVADSRDPSAALEILLDRSAFSPTAPIEHIGRVLDGAASPWTLTARYGWWLAAIVGLPSLIALGVLRSIFGGVFALFGFGRRRTRVIREVVVRAPSPAEEAPPSRRRRQAERADPAVERAMGSAMESAASDAAPDGARGGAEGAAERRLKARRRATSRPEDADV